MSLTLEQLSQSLQLPFVGDPHRRVTKACPLESPQIDGLSFCEKSQQVKLVGDQLGILIAPQEPSGESWNALISPHPRVSFAQALGLLYPEPTRAGGVHPTAWVDATAQVHPNAWVGPLCSLGPGTLLADGCRLVAQVELGAHCSLGARTVVQPGVSLGDGCKVGDDCVLEPGVRLLQRTHVGDRVWLGARNVLDGCQLGSGIKTDNMVYIGPGSEIGDHALLIAQSCAGPNTRMGAYSLLAAQGVVVGNVELAPQVQVAGRGVVYESVLTSGTAVAGDPAVAYKLELRARALRAQALSLYQQALKK
ncbi:hypothetical protein IV102_08970 [bacterium]|nr:hypothetical protein [bacterium]